MILHLQLRPSVWCPTDGTLDEHGGAVLGGAVAVADEDVLAVYRVGGAVAGSLPFLLVALQEERAAAVGHVLARAVEIRTVDGLATAYGHAVVALGTAAAVVPRHEEVVVAAMLEDERGLDGVGAGMFRRGVLFHGLVVRGIAAGDGARFHALGNMHRRVETGQLDAVPERAPDEPGLVVVVDDEVGVDGVPVVALLARGHDAALVLPHVRAQRAAAQQADG